MSIPERPSWFTASMRRRLLIVAYTVGVVLAILTAVALSFAIAFWPKLERADRLSAVNDALAGSALLVSVIGGCMALQAHAAAIGKPDVKAQLWFGSDPKNMLLLVMQKDADGRIRSAPGASQNNLHIRLKNAGKFPAANLVVTVHLRGLVFERALEERIGDWRIVDFEAGLGATAAEWIGETVFHAETTRRLPDLDLRSVLRIGDEPPAVHLYVLADRFSHPIRSDVRMLTAHPRVSRQVVPLGGAQTWL